MSDIYYAVAHRKQEEIDSFKTRYEDFDDSLIPEIFEVSIKQKVKNWKASNSWGSSHVIYYVDLSSGEKLVLRANTGWGEPETAMLMEKLVTDKVLQSGLPTNKVVHVDISRKHFPFDFQIEEDIGGIDPEASFLDLQPEYDQLSFELGQYIARLSDISLPGFGRFDEQKLFQGKLYGTKPNLHDYLMVCVESDSAKLVAEDIVTKNQAQQIIAVLANSENLISIQRGSLVHHDLADHNLRYENGHLKVVFDWEAAIVGDPTLDLASCPTWKTLYPREKKLVEGYSSIRNLPENYAEKRDIYRLRTMLWKMVYAIRARIVTPDRVERFTLALEPFGI